MAGILPVQKGGPSSAAVRRQGKAPRTANRSVSVGIVEKMEQSRVVKRLDTAYDPNTVTLSPSLSLYDPSSRQRYLSNVTERAIDPPM